MKIKTVLRIYPTGKNHPMFGVHRFGKDAPNWRDGLTKDINAYHRKYALKYRHERGISKNYYTCGNKIDKKISKKRYNQSYKRRVREGGKLPLSRIQLVYEDNIKKYGTLTCVYCLQPIIFSQDTIDHKTPLSRGGNNEYNNLTISCRICNCKKHTKNELEYRKGIKSYV